MYLNPKKLGNFVDVAQCVIYAVEIHIGLQFFVFTTERTNLFNPSSYVFDKVLI